MMISVLNNSPLRVAGALLGLWAALVLIACTPPTLPEPESNEASTIVFVHGAWGGGWQFHKVQPLLEEAGYRVYRPTLTGLGERVHLAGPEVGLGTHIEDIVKVFEFEELENVVLVGHSYGGMVITGVAERIPERIRRLVYLDAILPKNGESVFGLFGEGIEYMATIGGEGYDDWQLVPRWVSPGTPPPVDVPQSVLSFSEAIELANPSARELPGCFILTIEAGKEDDDFAPFAARARERGWPVVEMEGDHNPHWFQPGNFVQVLLEMIA